ncbi:Gfo/Idh/MocA family protein [Priestia megaterium]|uniref:Gfo/Idh/MocA family protein n=1 Tax=Priestia megaterium TaxID=1404 RepID=UPI00244B4284|nr:Gfo/Idh/MocA family oxidoreductase [Priestia megaterium]MDH2363329.1 Gfo/Idh/MocA family oxidoreductase [Priestia megaterium]
MKKIRWGILSAANIAYDQLLPALRRSERAEVIAIASRSKGRAERFNIPTIYKEYDQLLEDPNIDAVYIPLPNALHAEWAIKAAKKGKHILIEKPAALSEAEVKDIQSAVLENDVIFMEAFMYQFHKQHQRVRELLDSNFIGSYVHVKAHFSWMLENSKDIRLNPDLGGGALRDVGCYGVHAMSQIIGMQPTKVTMGGRVHPEYKVDTTSTCIFTDEKGRTAEVTASMELPFINRYEIIGPKGTILVDSSFRPDVSPDHFGKIIVKDSNNQTVLYEAYEDDQYLNQVEHLHDCIIHGQQPKYSIEDSLQVIHYIEKGYESLDNSSLSQSLSY